MTLPMVLINDGRVIRQQPDRLRPGRELAAQAAVPRKRSPLPAEVFLLTLDEQGQRILASERSAAS